MRILLVVHGFPPSAGGGTEVYVHDFAVALVACGRDEVFVLTRDADPHRPELSVRRTVQNGVRVVAINNLFQACASYEESYTHPALRAVARDLVAAISPDVVHVQHLTCLSIGLLEDIAARAVPLVMTLNDYWLICHRGQLLDRDGRRCGGPFDGGCAACIPAGMLAGPATYRAGRLARALPVPGAARAVQLAMKATEAATPASRTAAAMARRLRHMREAARHVDLFLAPSRTMTGMFGRFGLDETKLMVCDQGIDLAPFEGLDRKPAATLRLGFAGSFIPSKAPHVLLESAALLPPGSVTIDLIGRGAAYHGDSDYALRLDPWLGHPAIRRLGPIPHERMAAALHDIDVLVVPSVWIENAPFIIREAFAAGAPVVASNLGGMAEMVRDGVDGRLFPPGDTRELAAILGGLAARPQEVERLRAGIRPPMSIDEDAARCRAIYASLARPDARFPVVTPAPAQRAPRVGAVVLNYRTPDQTTLAVRSIQSSFVRPERVFVVDNGSGDGSADALKRSLDGATVIENAANLGFSAGCNVGIRAALDSGAEHVLLVNSDAVLAPDALGRMLEAIAADPSLGIVAPVLLSREEPDRIASAGISFSARTCRMRNRGAGMPVSLLPPGPVHDVDAVSACVMLIRRDVFQRAGDLDAEYFFSFEDIDLCLRARAAGYRTACVQEAFAYHEGGRSIGRRSARRVYFATRNHLRLSRSAGSGGAAARTALVVGLNVAYVLVSPEAPLVSGLFAVAKGAWHHAIGRYGSD